MTVDRGSSSAQCCRGTDSMIDKEQELCINIKIAQKHEEALATHWFADASGRQEI